ncbi:Undecaprenyl phosphate-alpha-4-amino-4-deoxy-L-arabinose arabinosyl transferase [bacterium HR15]|nr:Undecaprenyl phosphate-alpha-4-amino-4-deoxy-L-arabinose arabinosyl transferase [bacterium HR15]
MRVLLWLLVLVALIDITAFGLTDLDEGFYASVAWEMEQQGDWWTPRFRHEPWFEKPPLLYWLMMFSMRLFGEGEFALRLPSVLLFGLTLILIVAWGERRLGVGVGALAGLLFALAPLSLLLTRLALTDMALCCWLTLALIALWEARERPLPWSLLGGVALGLAILTKGPVGLGLIGLHYLLNARALHAQGLRLRWVLFALIAAVATAVPWYLGVYVQHGRAFFEEFVLRQNLMRFAGGDTAHSVLPLIQRGGAGNIAAGIAIYLLFYGVVLWLGALPMSLWAGALWHRELEEPPVAGYLRRWAWLVFGLFTVSFTKLPAYIFPMLPAFALLVAFSLTARREPRPPGTFRHSLFATRYLPFALGGLALAIWTLLGMVVAQLSGVWQAGLLGIGLSMVALWLASGQHWAVPLWLGILTLLLGLNGALRGYDRLMLAPVRELAQAVPPYRTLILYRVHPGYPSLQFYRRGRTATVDNLNALLQQMESQGAYCLTTDDTLTTHPRLLLLEHRRAAGRTFYLLVARYR